MGEQESKKANPRGLSFVQHLLLKTENPCLRQCLAHLHWCVNGFSGNRFYCLVLNQAAMTGSWKVTMPLHLSVDTITEGVRVVARKKTLPNRKGPPCG